MAWLLYATEATYVLALLVLVTWGVCLIVGSEPPPRWLVIAALAWCAVRSLRSLMGADRP